MALRQHIRLEMEQVVAALSRLSRICTGEQSERSFARTFDNEGIVETSPRSLQLRASSQIRRTAWTFRLFVVTFACVMAATVNKAQENRAASERPGENEASVRVGTATLVRVELRGLKNWKGIKTGTVLEGCLALPIYEGREMKAPAGSQVRVTVESTEKIREVMGFWKKMGRIITRAFNPLETSHPGDIRCGTPDCDWGHRVSDFSEEQLELCYSEFRKHCMQRHDLQEWEIPTSLMNLNLEHWTLTLIKR